MVLGLVKRARPGSFIDARLSADPVNAIIYRTRQPIIHELNEVPMLQDFGIFKVSAIMASRTQVAICVRFADTVEAEVVQGDHVRFVSKRARGNIGDARTAMKTTDFLIFDFTSRNALLLKKLVNGRGYGAKA